RKRSALIRPRSGLPKRPILTNPNPNVKARYPLHRLLFPRPIRRTRRHHVAPYANESPDVLGLQIMNTHLEMICKLLNYYYRETIMPDGDYCQRTTASWERPFALQRTRTESVWNPICGSAIKL